METKSSDQIEFSLGWGATGLVGSLGLKFTNFAIQNLFNKKAYRIVPQGEGQTFSINARTNGIYYTSASISFLEPWLGGKRPNSLSASIYFANQTGYSSRLYEIVFHPINPRKNEVIYEDRTVTVETVPLKHGVPCCGFLFKETRRVPKEDGSFEHVTRKRYAYCTDTEYNEKIVPIIEGVDALYHESTFLQEMAARSKEVKHSTAAEAATIAQKANVGKLILGHYSARVEDHSLFLQEAKPIFENTLLAEENDVIEI